MENEEAYKEITDRILESKIKLFGYFAVRVAKAIPGLELDDYGKVISISRDPKEVVRDLLSKFEEKAGKVSTTAVRAYIVGLRNKYPWLELPEELM